MEKLFKHIEGNRFKLNETVDKSISKMEEDMGLNYIRRVLIPLGVNNWNRLCSKRKGAKDCPITQELVSKNLKKIGHVSGVEDDKTTTDVISYQSISLTMPDGSKEPFVFELYKHIQNGRLMAAVASPGDNFRIHFVGQKLEENSEPVIKNPKYTINKMEEMESLQYIRNTLIPRAVEFWNKLAIPLHWRVTDKDISQNLKKVKHKIGSTYRTDVIYYMSVVKLAGQKRNHHFKFIIYKDDTGKLQSAFDVGASGFGYNIIDKNNQLKHAQF